jgi:hypothetical protein
MAHRYAVEPCDEDDGRRTWDVVRYEGRNAESRMTMANRATRSVARAEALALAAGAGA